MTERLPSDAECPACAPALGGLEVVDNGIVCPECGERVTPAMTVPRRVPRPPLWKSGTIPGFVLLVYGLTGWLAAMDGETLLFWFLPLCVFALICLCVGVMARVRSVDRRYRARTLVLRLLIAAGWSTPGAMVFVWAMR